MPDWRDEASKILESAWHQSLKIVLWGPGDPGRKGSDYKRRAYNKRVQIKEVLSDIFLRAGTVPQVYMSEDPEMQNLAPDITDKLLQETLQARTADLVLALAVPGSRGVDLEIDFFVPNFPWIRDKIYILLPKQFVKAKGLVKEVFDFLKPDHLVGYSQKEFDECKVATEKAVRIATAAALNKRLRDV